MSTPYTTMADDLTLRMCKHIERADRALREGKPDLALHRLAKARACGERVLAMAPPDPVTEAFAAPIVADLERMILKGRPN